MARKIVGRQESPADKAEEPADKAEEPVAPEKPKYLVKEPALLDGGVFIEASNAMPHILDGYEGTPSALAWEPLNEAARERIEKQIRAALARNPKNHLLKARLERLAVEKPPRPAEDEEPVLVEYDEGGDLVDMRPASPVDVKI